jgi:hypothetical protein
VNSRDHAPASAEALEDDAELEDALGVEVGLGLVEDQEVGVAEERAREHDPARLAARELGVRGGSRRLRRSRRGPGAFSRGPPIQGRR